MFRTEVTFPPADTSSEYLFIGRWTSDDFVPPSLQFTTRWLYPQRMSSADSSYAEDLAHVAARDVRQWIADTEVFPVSLYPGDGPHLLTAFTEVMGHVEDLSELIIRRDEDSLGVTFGFTYWDFVNLDQREVLECLNSTHKWYSQGPSSPSRANSPSSSKPAKRIDQFSEDLEPRVPDFKDWQVRQIFEVFGGAQIVRIQRVSHLYSAGEMTHLGTQRFLGQLVIVRTDYLRVDNKIWKLQTEGIKTQDMQPNR